MMLPAGARRRGEATRAPAATFADDGLLRRRVRAGLWITLCGSTLLLIGDVVLHPAALRSIAWPKLVLLASVLASFAMLRRARGYAALRSIAVFVASMIYVTTGIASIILGDVTRAPLLFTVIAMASSVVPWGPRSQLATLLVAWLVFGVSVALVGASGRLDDTAYVAVAFATASVAAYYASWEFARYRSERVRADQAQLARRQAEDEARMSSTLARIGREVTTSLQTATIARRLCQLAAEALDADAGVVLLEDGRELEDGLVAAALGDGDLERAASERTTLPGVIRLARDVLADHDVAALDVVQSVALLARTAHATLGPGLAIALRTGHRLVGVVLLLQREPRAGWGTNRLLAHGIGRIGASALANARLVEQVERASRLKSEFVSTMSHELRTPLNVILGNAEMLEDPAVSPEQRNVCVRTIARAGRELLELVENTLEIGRLEAARSELRIEQISLADLWRDLRVSCADLPRRSGVQLEWVGPGTEQQIAVDRRKLATVVRNLVGNALKFTERGKVRAEAGLSAGGLELRVADTGIGIPADRHGEIFEMFRQIDGSDSRAHGGSGLGLYIVRSFVEELGGTIALDSAVGRGSTFTVTLPAHSDEGTQSPRPVGQSPTGRHSPARSSRPRATRADV
jgi:signal transduction histidine kinase